MGRSSALKLAALAEASLLVARLPMMAPSTLTWQRHWACACVHVHAHACFHMCITGFAGTLYCVYVCEALQYHSQSWGSGLSKRVSQGSSSCPSETQGADNPNSTAGKAPSLWPEHQLWQ